jgi:hypothetical protein
MQDMDLQMNVNAASWLLHTEVSGAVKRITHQLQADGNCMLGVVLPLKYRLADYVLKFDVMENKTRGRQK